jgi:pimeloyl-ACP methyl ester carboxylesterase
VLGQRLSLVAERHSFGKAPIDQPCLYLRASHDRLVPSHCATWFQQRIRNCEVRDVDGPHFLLQARPRETARMIAGFIAGKGDE